MKKIFFNEDNLSIYVSDTYNNEALELLENAVFGNKGIRYKHTNLHQTLSKLINPYFFYLYQQDELIGFYCLCKRNINFNQKNIDAFYGRYFVSKHMGFGHGKLLKYQAVKYAESINVRSILFYSYIEQNNIHSLNISKNQNFISHAQIQSFLFFRFSPKICVNIDKISKNEISTIRELLKHNYKEHSLLLLENIGYDGNYFVYKENGQIIAGLQANPVLWKIIKIDGLLGRLLKTIDKIPYLNRMLNTNYQFLAIEGIYLKADCKEDILYKLLEHTLAHFKFNTALLQLDQKDILAKKLVLDKKLGIVNQLNETIITHVMLKTETHNIDESPIYISSFDFA
jgi:hypothetical protein